MDKEDVVHTHSGVLLSCKKNGNIGICSNMSGSRDCHTRWNKSDKGNIIWCHLHAEKAVAPHSSTLAWKIPWTEEPGRLQSMALLRVRHDWVTSLTFHFHALEKEMATHSSVLAWRIPGTGEPGGLPSLGSHRVGHDWSNLAAAWCFYS